MAELNSPDNVYTTKWLKQKLKYHLYFTELPGETDAVCFEDIPSYILYELKKKSSQTNEEIHNFAAIWLNLTYKSFNNKNISIQLSMISTMMALHHVGFPKV